MVSAMFHFYLFIFQVCVKEKLTVELLPEVEKSLACGEMKHRKHPGKRKIEPVSVPEVLKANVDNIIGGNN